MISLQSFPSMVRQMATTARAAASIELDFNIGSVLRAVTESVAGLGMWLQFLALSILQSTRLSTSSGTDVDSFVGDWGLVRLQPVAATGAVTFTRVSPTIATAIPVGALVQTSDGTLNYLVNLDTTNSAYDAASNTYLLGVGVTSVTVPIIAAVGGTDSNVIAGSISNLASSINYVDAVSNALPLTNGIDAETDAALKTRFAAYISSLRAATVGAMIYAVSLLQQGLSVSVLENTMPNGTTVYGYNTVVVDDGTGSPPSLLLSNAYAAVDAVRAAGTRLAVIGPTILPLQISMTVAVQANGTLAVAEANVAAAITAYIEGLGVGSGLNYLRLAQIAYSADNTVSAVTQLTLNGGQADVAGGPGVVLRIASLAVN